MVASRLLMRKQACPSQVISAIGKKAFFQRQKAGPFGFGLPQKYHAIVPNQGFSTQMWKCVKWAWRGDKNHESSYCRIWRANQDQPVGRARSVYAGRHTPGTGPH